MISRKIARANHRGGEGRGNNCFVVSLRETQSCSEQEEDHRVSDPLNSDKGFRKIPKSRMAESRAVAKDPRIPAGATESGKAVLLFRRSEFELSSALRVPKREAYVWGTHVEMVFR